MSMSVLVTEAHSRIALAISRSLGKKGLKVGCISHKAYAHSFFSRYCHSRFLCTNPSENSLLFIKTLLKLLKHENFDVLLPVEQETVLLISKNKALFAPYVKIPFVDFNKMVKATNKAFLMKFASKLGIPHPKTYLINSADEVRKVSEELDYPIVIKPSIGSGAWGVTYARTPADLRTKFEGLHRIIGEYPLVQEHVPGVGYGVEALYNEDSQLRAVVVHKRLEEYPMTGGQSTVRETVRDREIESLAIKLLSAFKWYGVANVEFKRDISTGRPVLMEINPRFWGSLSLAIAAGVDFPSLLYEIAINDDVEPISNYRVGVKARWLLPGDILSFVETLIYGRKKIRRTLDFLKMYEKGMVYDELSRGDLSVFPGLICQLSSDFLKGGSIQTYVLRSSTTNVLKR